MSNRTACLLLDDINRNSLIDTLNRYVMVFKYADGGSLRSYLSNPSVDLDWPTRCKLGINIINGLKHLHDRGILHKDLVIIDVYIKDITFRVDYNN